MFNNHVCCINPLVPSAHKSVRIAKISILKLEGIIKKISYERRDYESVDENSVVPSTFASEFDTRKALYWKDPLLYANWSSRK